MIDGEQRLFARVEALFHEFSELEADEREQRLAAIARESPELHGELVALFGDGESAARRLREQEGALDDMVGTAEPAGSAPQPGWDLGPYRLLRLIGEGGMGRVFEAEQSEPIRRRVAVKVMRRGFESAAVQARFEVERQALAVMNHAHVARILDVGATDKGQPWFAMELIEGLPITQWANEQGLGLEERLELMLPVCDAIQHAHSKGVVHRDVKPSNILVRTDETGRVQPVVIDFGIAKAIQNPMMTQAFATRLGELVGTPEYMSPEQASLGAIDIDTRSDVYGLGLVLYELLVGELPLPMDRLRGLPFDEICRRIREDQTPRPSSKVASPKPGPFPSSASRRQRAELDNVVLKALAKDRDHRYASAVALADDLRRFLRHEAVVAAPASWRYRAAKFIRRHRLPVALASLTVAALVVGFALSVYGLLEARRAAASSAEARERAERARTEAEASLRTSEETTEYLVGLFQAADPRQDASLGQTVGDLLERGVERIDDLEDEPAVQARMLEALGRVHWSLGHFDAAEPLLERALELRRQKVPDAERQAAVLNRLGSLYRDRAEPARAEQNHRQAVILLEAAGLDKNAEMGNSLNSLGVALSRQERYGEAAEVLERAMVLAEMAEPGPSGNVAAGLLNLAVTRYRAGAAAEALQDARRSLAIFEQVLPDGHANLADVHSNISDMANRLGAVGLALEHARLALDVDRQALPAGHPYLAFDLAKVARSSWRYGLEAEAVAAGEESLAILEKAFEPNTYRHVSHRAEVLALRALAMGQPAAALESLEAVLDFDDGSEEWKKGSKITLSRLRTYAIALRRSGRFEEAQAALEEARQRLERLRLENPGDGKMWASFQVASALVALDLEESRAAADYAAAVAAAGCGFSEPCPLDDALNFVLRAHWHARSGEVDAAFCTLALAIEHSGWGAWILAGPELAALPRDGRWAQLEARLAHRREASHIAPEPGERAASPSPAGGSELCRGL